MLIRVSAQLVYIHAVFVAVIICIGANRHSLLHQHVERIEPDWPCPHVILQSRAVPSPVGPVPGTIMQDMPHGCNTYCKRFKFARHHRLKNFPNEGAARMAVFIRGELQRNAHLHANAHACAYVRVHACINRQTTMLRWLCSCVLMIAGQTGCGYVVVPAAPISALHHIRYEPVADHIWALRALLFEAVAAGMHVWLILASESLNPLHMRGQVN